jgi:HK97 family phage portal protein
MPSFIQRVQSAMRAFRQTSASPARIQRKEIPYLWPEFLTGEPQWHLTDLNAYIQEGMSMNALIYNALMFKYRALSSAPLRAYTGDPKRPDILPETTPLGALVFRPNQYQGRVQFVGQAVIYLNVTGNSYTYIERSREDRSKVARLWNLRPDRVYIVPGEKGTIKGYRYRPAHKTFRDAIPILPEDMIHVKLPNPADEFEGLGYGLSPFAPLAQSGDIDNSVTKMLKSLFDNKTMLGGVLKYDVQMDDADMAEARRRWDERYGGASEWGAVAILDSGGTFTPFTPDFTKLDFKSVDKRNEQRVIGPFGVPGLLIGVGMENSTYSNYSQAETIFWRNTFVPELALFESEFQHRLNQQEQFVAFDTSNISALQENVSEKVDSSTKLIAAGVPPRIAFMTVGLNVPEYDGDDLPRQQAPQQVAIAPPTDEPPPDEPPVEEDIPPEPDKSIQPAQRKSFSDAERKAIWKALDNIATVHESKFENAARKCLENDQREILLLVEGAKEKALRLKAAVDWLGLDEAIKTYLRATGAPFWAETFVPLFEGVVGDAANYWGVVTGKEVPPVRNLLGEAWFADYKLAFAQPINDTTSEAMHGILGQAQKEGWSIDRMRNNLQSLFQQWKTGDVSAEDLAWLEARNTPYRAEMIARTETTRIQAAGSQALFKEWNVKKKEWLATNDDRTRDSHASADGQIRDIDEPFDVGSSHMMHPGDMSMGAPASEIVFCRCTHLPVLDD